MVTHQNNPKFEPGVQKYLDDEETKEIRHEYKSTTVNLGYKPPRKKFKPEQHKPITIFSQEILEAFDMTDFNFVQLAKDAGLVNEEGDVIIEGKPTPALKKVWLLALNNMRAVKVYTKSFINPKSSISFDGEKYKFGSGDIKNFILHHFPNQYSDIKKLNATDTMTSLIRCFENNPCRLNQPLGIMSMSEEEDAKRKDYFVDDLITLFSFDQLLTLMNTSRKKPHYTKKQYDELLEEVLKIDKKLPQKVSAEPLDLTPDLSETSPEPDSQIDDSLPPAIEVFPEERPAEEISVEQVININALKRILGSGDSITITIQYTKSSGE